MIETTRLRLRQPTVQDIDGYCSLYSEPEASEIFGMPPLSAEDAWNRLLRSIGHWSHFKYGLMIVEDRQSGGLIGEAGYANFHRGNGPSFDDYPEAGWRIASRERGKGLASETMLAATRWFTDQLHPTRAVCMIHPANAPSLAVASRIGFSEFGRHTYKDRPVILMAKDWESPRG
jgi:RimJ/RimL family protein N-acetyltransferase